MRDILIITFYNYINEEFSNLPFFHIDIDINNYFNSDVKYIVKILDSNRRKRYVHNLVYEFYVMILPNYVIKKSRLVSNRKIRTVELMKKTTTDMRLEKINYLKNNMNKKG